MANPEKAPVVEKSKKQSTPETPDQLAKTLETDKEMQSLRQDYIKAINRIHALLHFKYIEGAKLNEVQKKVMTDEVEAFMAQAAASIEIDEGSRSIRMKASRKIAGIFKLKVDHVGQVRSEEEVQKQMPRLNFKVDMIALTPDGKESETARTSFEASVLDTGDTLVVFHGLNGPEEPMLFPEDEEVAKQFVEAQAQAEKKASIPPYLRRVPPQKHKLPAGTLNEKIAEMMGQFGGGGIGAGKGGKPIAYWNVDFFFTLPLAARKDVTPGGRRQQAQVNSPTFNVVFKLRM